jgi:TolB-like protein
MTRAPEIFLSYCREDQAIARRFADGLQREGFSVWWDQALDAGETFDQVTEQSLRDARAVVVLWSKNAVQSRWVRAEATQADRFQTLVPVTIEPCDRPIMFELTHTADLAGWSGDPADGRWRAFIEGLRRFTEKGRAADSTTPRAPPAPAPSVKAGTTHPAPRSPIRWAVAAAALLAVVAGLYWFLPQRQAKTTNEAVEASVAVLPFEDLSEGQDQEYFADGISEEILNVLAGVRGLEVTARTSSFAFKGKTQDLRAIGEALNVAHVLEGSVRKAGNRLRITAQLINSRTGYHLWSKTYDRELDDVFGIQTDIAKSVAESLQVSLGVGDFANSPGSTRNVEAYDLYLTGTRSISEASPESMQRGMDDLKRAVALDPGFARAWMRLWEIYSQVGSFIPEPPGQSWQQLAEGALAEARRLAPDAFFIVFSDIDARIAQGAWGEAEKLFDEVEARAASQGVQIDLDGNRGLLLLTVGRFREAIVFLERARSRDPLNANRAAILAETYAASGNLAAAFAEIDRGLKSQTHVRLLGNALVIALSTHDRTLIESRLDAFVAQQATGSELHAAMRPLLEQPAQGLAELRRFSADSRSPQLQAAAGVWAAYFGDPETALTLLRTPTIRTNPTDFTRFWRPVARDVRKLPGFKQLARDLGLVDYWREHGWPDLCKPVGSDDFECS